MGWVEMLSEDSAVVKKCFAEGGRATRSNIILCLSNVVGSTFLR